MRHPEAQDEILFNFKYNLREKLKLLNYGNYVETFGSVNASQLMKDIVPKSGISLRASNLFLAKKSPNKTGVAALPVSTIHEDDATDYENHEISQHFKNK